MPTNIQSLGENDGLIHVFRQVLSRKDDLRILGGHIARQEHKCYDSKEFFHKGALIDRECKGSVFC